MATTFLVSQYKTWVRNKLDNTSFDDAVLTQLITDVNADICNEPVKWPFMETTFVGTVGTSTNAYLHPTDLQQVINFTVTLPTNRIVYLDYMPYEEFNQRYPSPSFLTPSQPAIWTQFDSKFIVGPAWPDQTYTLSENYIKTPTMTLSDSSTLNVPDDFRELVVLGAYARALEHDDQPDYATAQYNRFQAQLSLMKQRYGIRQSGTPLVIQTRRSLLRGLPRGR